MRYAWRRGLLLLALLSALSAQADVAGKLRDGCRLLTAGRWDGATQAFRDAYAGDAQCAEALSGQGVSSLLAGFTDAAQTYFSQAAQLQSDQPAAHLGLASVCFRRHDYEGALREYALLRDYAGPHRAALAATIAQVACMGGQYDVAEAQANEALKLDADNELALQVLAASLLARGRASEACQVMQRPWGEPAAQDRGLLAPSPLFAPYTRYYAQRNLQDTQRLQGLTGQGVAVGAVAPPTPEPQAQPAQTVMTRGDASFYIEWPKAGAKVSGKLELTVVAAPEAGIQYVAVLLGTQFAGISNAMPLRLYVETGIVPDGLCEIRVDGYDNAGNVAKTASVVVNVANGRHTLSDDEQRLRDSVEEYQESLLLLRAHPLLRAQLVGNALEAVGRLQEAMDAYEYAFSYEPTLPGVRASLLLTYQKLGLPQAITQHEIHHLPGSGVVALTFDDGPHPVLTPWILDLLDKYHAKATFLLVGKQVAMYPELAREIVRRGHQVGIHSYTHMNMRRLSSLAVEREMVMTRMIIRRATGEFPTLFRPPGGNYDEQVREAVTATNFATVFWNENITSYPGQTGPEILPKMLHKIGDNSIVLLHNGYDETTEVLPLLLPALAQRGLRMGTISELTSHRPVRLQPLTIYPADWNL